MIKLNRIYYQRTVLSNHKFPNPIQPVMLKKWIKQTIAVQEKSVTDHRGKPPVSYKKNRRISSTRQMKSGSNILFFINQSII